MKEATIYVDDIINIGLASQLRETIKSFGSLDVLNVVIHSVGGATGEARAIRNMLLELKAQGTKIITKAVGYCDSSAVMIFGAGDERLIDEFNESFLIHQPTNSIEGATPEMAMEFAQGLEQVRNDIARIYQKDFGIEYNKAIELIKAEKSLTPEQALNLGFATKINRVNVPQDVYKILNQAPKPINVTPEEINERRKEYNAIVNMSFSELKRWSETECSKKAGQDRRPVARNLELLDLNAGDWTEKHYRWAGQTIAFIGRMKENLGGENVLKDSNGKECGTKAKISLKNWAFDPDKSNTNNKSYNHNNLEMNLKSINKKGNLQDWGNAKLAGFKTTNAYLAHVALKEYAKFVSEGGKPNNLNLVLEDDTVLYVYTDTEDLTGKRVVVADADGNPTETPAPDGEHTLQDGKVIVVSEGLISEVREAEAEPENMEKEKEEMAMKETKPEDAEKEKEDMMYKDKEKDETLNKILDTVTNLSEKIETKKEEKKETETMNTQNQKPENVKEATPDIEKLINDEVEKRLSEVQSTKTINRAGTVNFNGEKVDFPKISPAKENPKFFEKPVVKKALNVAKVINQRHYNKPFNDNTIAFTGNDYTGDALLQIMARVLLGGDSVEKGLWTVVPNIKFKKRITIADFEPIFKDASAMFTPSTNDLDIEYRAWTPKVSEAQHFIETEKIRESYHEVLLGEGSMADYIPPQVLADFWGSRMAERAKNTMDSLYWRGKAYTSNYTATADYPSIIQKAVADATVTKKSAPVNGSKTITGITAAAEAVVTVNNTTDLLAGDVVTFTGVVGMTQINGLHGQILEVINATSFRVNINSTAFTAYVSGGAAKYINKSNVIPCLESVINFMNEAVRLQEDVYIAVPPKVALAYSQAQASVATGSGSYFIGEKELDFLGTRMVVCNYMMPNTIWVNRTANNLLGLDLLVDDQTIRVIYEGATTQNDIITAKIRVKSDVNYAIADEVAMISGLL